jgi:hypothetical protein
MNDDGLDKLRDAFWMLVLNRVLSVMPCSRQLSGFPR